MSFEPLFIFICHWLRCYRTGLLFCGFHSVFILSNVCFCFFTLNFLCLTHKYNQISIIKEHVQHFSSNNFSQEICFGSAKTFRFRLANKSVYKQNYK